MERDISNPNFSFIIPAIKISKKEFRDMYPDNVDTETKGITLKELRRLIKTQRSNECQAKGVISVQD